MLKQLRIQNFALIDQVEIDFDDGLSVITGETGAGKSILLGALSLILGNRADHDSLKDKNQKCIVEGLFNVTNYKLEAFFESEDLDFVNPTIIRREINPQGKSRNFINDTPTTLDVMKALGNQLIDIHSQHQSLKINDASFQLGVIDALAGNSAKLTSYQVNFESYRRLSKELSNIKRELQEKKQQEDYLKFQFEELASLNLISGEIKTLEEEQTLFANSEFIINNLSQLINGLSQSDENILDKVAHLKQLMDQIVRYDSSLSESVDRMNSLQIELRDLAAEMESKAEAFQHDPERQQLVEERLSEIHRLQLKHHLSDAEDLIELQASLEEQLLGLSTLDGNITALEEQLEKLHIELKGKADELRNKRMNALPDLTKRVESMLNQLGMPFAVLKIEHRPLETFNSYGLDGFEFLFSANKGMDAQAIAKTASGGEISRLMLAIKALLAEYKQLPTILFDEIDTGVSGEVAYQMGVILNQIGMQRQVISITHLPQIAAKGKSHYFVYKKIDEDRSITEIKRLDEHERVEEVAKMLSGDKLSEAARINAKELLSQ